MKEVFSDYGIKILKDNGKYFIQFDGGELVEKTVQIEVSGQDAKLAQQSENDAYEIIIKYQNQTK